MLDRLSFMILDHFLIHLSRSTFVKFLNQLLNLLLSGLLVVAVVVVVVSLWLRILFLGPVLVVRGFMLVLFFVDSDQPVA